jgi:phosphohistidine phosphatase
MTLTLVLIRHAKSDWDDPLLDDHDRPLNARGLSDAPRIGAWLLAQGHVPGAAMVSTARRAVATWDALVSAFAPPPPISFHPRLYHASAGIMLDVLRTAEAPTIAMIGHNPGIGDFAARLLTTAPTHPCFDDYPTCATLVARFDAGAWADVQFRTGAATAFITPHDLG